MKPLKLSGIKRAVSINGTADTRVSSKAHSYRSTMFYLGLESVTYTE